MKKLLFSLLLAFGAAILFPACKDDDDNTPPQRDIVELAQNTPELSTLVAALQRANLVDALKADGPFTVFAPTNAAFTQALNTLGYANLDAVPVDVLTQILLYHVVGSEVRSTQLTNNSYTTTLATFSTTNNALSLYIETTGGVKLNKTTTVTSADVTATNGVVHIVDAVLVPPTVVNHALNNPNFSSLVAALTRSDLGVDYVSTLSGTGPFTVFAPTNAAFSALLTELGVSSLNDIPAATLNAVLQYHVVPNANVRSTALTDEQVVTTLQTGTFRVDLTGGAKIIDGQNRTTNIIITDVQGTNGVVHAIDRVLLP